MKTKILEFREKPFNKGNLIYKEDVSHLNKKSINQRWDELQKSYSPEKYQSCLIEM